MDSETYPSSTLFFLIRSGYMNILEKILESEPVAGVTEAILDDFKAKHRSGAFFCRHRKCPRAAQGFNNPELRQMHEKSHIPKFQCTEVACGFFGRPFNTQAAFKKHTIQYHDEERIASIPESLANVQCHAHKDRSLFTLTKSKEKRRNEEHDSPRAPSGGILVENDGDDLSRADANWMRDFGPDWEVDSNRKALNTWSCEVLDLFHHNEAVDKHDEDFAATGQVRPSDTFDYYAAILDSDKTDGLSIEGEVPPPQIIPSRSVRYETPPLKAGFTDLLQKANAEHLTTKAAPPAVDASEQPSPFQASSRFAADNAHR